MRPAPTLLGRPLRVVFAGGGTGGHLMPGLAVARELLAADPASRVAFLAQGKPAEREMIEAAGFALEAVPSGRLSRSPLPLAAAGLSLSAGLLRACSVLRRMRPDAVVGLGGYASAPTLAAARCLGVPIFLMEQNAILGKVNRWFAPRARAVFLPWERLPAEERRKEGLRDPGGRREADDGPAERALSRTRVAALGNPVRAEIRALGERPRPPRSGPPTVLVTGGSQGARAVNELVLRILPWVGELPERPRFLHVAGRGNAPDVEAGYRRHGLDARVLEFTHRMQDLYAEADVAVSRAGGTTLAELAACGIPSVLVPLPTSAEDHQRANARVFERAGAARIVEEGPGAGQAMEEALAPLLRDAARRSSMAEAARGIGKPLASLEIAAWIQKEISTGEGSS